MYFGLGHVHRMNCLLFLVASSVLLSCLLLPTCSEAYDFTYRGEDEPHPIKDCPIKTGVFEDLRGNTTKFVRAHRFREAIACGYQAMNLHMQGHIDGAVDDLVSEARKSMVAPSMAVSIYESEMGSDVCGDRRYAWWIWDVLKCKICGHLVVIVCLLEVVLTSFHSISLLLLLTPHLSVNRMY